MHRKCLCLEPTGDGTRTRRYGAWSSQARAGLTVIANPASYAEIAPWLWDRLEDSEVHVELFRTRAAAYVHRTVHLLSALSREPGLQCFYLSVATPMSGLGCLQQHRRRTK